MTKLTLPIPQAPTHYSYIANKHLLLCLPSKSKSIKVCNHEEYPLSFVLTSKDIMWLANMQTQTRNSEA